VPSKTKAGAVAMESERPAGERREGRDVVGAAPAGAGMLRVKQVRSGIGHPKGHRATLRSIGLKHHQDVVVVPDSPSLRGMLNQVRHLVEVTKVEEA